MNNLTSNLITFQVGNEIAADSVIKVIISNLLTQNTTQQTSSFSAASFASNNQAIDVSANSLGLSVQGGNAFNLLNLVRSSSANSGRANYIISFQQIQNSSNVSVISFQLSTILLTTELSRVYQQLNDSSLIPLVFSKINSSYIRVTLSQTGVSTITIVLS